jgi:hypothetical protein
VSNLLAVSPRAKWLQTSLAFFSFIRFDQKQSTNHDRRQTNDDNTTVGRHISHASGELPSDKNCKRTEGDNIRRTNTSTHVTDARLGHVAG